MHPADIKAHIAKAGLTQTAIAKRLKINQSAVTMVISGKSRSRRIATAIADIIGRPVEKIWPNAYRRKP